MNQWTRALAGWCGVGLCVGASDAWPQSILDGVLRSRAGVVADAAVFLVPTGVAAAVLPTKARIDQISLTFVPPVVVVTPGSIVEFPNSDVVMHNVFHPGRGTRAFDLGTYPRYELRAFTFQEAGLFVMLCHVHPEKVAYVAVAPSDFRVSTDAEGHFAFDGVPPGSYRLHVWHRKFVDPDLPVTVQDGHTSVSPVLVAIERHRGLGTP